MARQHGGARDARMIGLCRDLTVAAPGRAIVRGLTLDVAPGEVVALMGPSGVGKSVLARVLFGIEAGRSKVADGSARAGNGEWVDGLTIEGEVGEAARRGALVPQFGAGLDYLCDWENVALAQPDPERPDGADARKAHSGGERRALLVERGIAAGRELIWLDEPAAGMDIGRTREVGARLRRLAADGVAIVITTHRVDLAHAVADRVVWLGGDGVVEERVRTAEVAELDAWLSDRLDRPAPKPTGLSAPKARFGVGIGAEAALDAVLALGTLLGEQPGLRFAGRAAGAAWRLVWLRGALFHAVVGAITAAIIYVSVRTSGGVTSAVRWLPELGMTIVLRVAQPLAAILAAASAGAAVSSWLGQMVARQELLGLEVLDVDTRKRVTAPAALGLAGAVLVHTLVFAAAMTAVFAGIIGGISDVPANDLGRLMRGAAAWLRPDQVALWLPKTVLYPLLVAGVTVGFARRPKPNAAAVGDALTAGIVRATIGVVLLELALLVPQLLP